MKARKFLRELRSALTRDWERQWVADQAGTYCRIRERERIIDQIMAFCPEHGNKPTSRMTCHCEIADELRRTR